MSKTRWFDVAAIVVAAGVVVGMAFTALPRHTPTNTAAPSVQHVDRPQQPTKSRQSVLFISDSYTAGIGLKEMFYGCLAAVRMGWLCDLSAQPGTGYISGGSANRFVPSSSTIPSTSFAERLPILGATYAPDIVILDGGRNDLFAPTDARFAVMSATIAGVRRTWPDARIVLVRPRSLTNPTDDMGYDDDFLDRLRAEPAADGMVVVDPIDRLTGADTSTMLSPVGSQPNQRGVRAMSSALVDSLLDNGFTAQVS